jgi:hypothetical protein
MMSHTRSGVNDHIRVALVLQFSFRKPQAGLRVWVISSYFCQTPMYGDKIE